MSKALCISHFPQNLGYILYNPEDFFLFSLPDPGELGKIQQALSKQDKTPTVTAESLMLHFCSIVEQSTTGGEMEFVVTGCMSVGL